MLFPILLSFVVGQRFIELIIAKRNEKQLKNSGAIEFGADHYPWIVLLHIGFFTVLLSEVLLLERGLSALWPIWLLLFTLAQIGRIWVISSLGKHWNTKIIVLPSANVVTKGPYKFLKHPNYIIVATEILVLSLLFNAYFTAIIFSLLNLWMMRVRIPIEEQALQEHTAYSSVFKQK